MSGMFCFCLHSSLLKLQALEVEGGPSLRPSPEESPPALGSKEQKSPSGPMELGGIPADENSPPELLPVLSRPLSPRPTPLTSIYPQQPLTDGSAPHPDGAPPPSPHPPAEGGGALLQLLGGGASPLPSPRCPSLSHRFNSDPDSAPSPPCSQQYILCRGPDRTEGSEDPACPPSIPSLTRHIQALKKKVRRFEDQFEQQMNYQPSHNDKYSNPEMVRVMGELAKARKQLKEKRLRQSVFESEEPDGPESSCRSATDQHPSLEETVESLFRRLREKKQALGLPDDTKEMTQAQLVLEKITLQKCLLYFESLHGRVGMKQKNVVKPLYDRYQLIKRLLCASPTITTIEEEDGSDEDSPPAATPPPRRASSELDGQQRDGEQQDGEQRDGEQQDGEPALVSPLAEVKSVRPLAALTTANLHEASRSELLRCLRQTRTEKKLRRKALREFEDEFHRQTGRICQKEDRTPMKEEYQDYKQLKAKLRLLEVLLSKQEVPRSM
ncbi:protein FAM13C-like isoform X2 [Sander lucioperca]|uniref:protein FAM13C-like isoform X2 n=1 Tax=Sander lucioperca TaxID=283035 RepID=UPI0016534868|nr:protein FAM13C-like isoform X2 [Sander lucioperca]